MPLNGHEGCRRGPAAGREQRVQGFAGENGAKGAASEGIEEEKCLAGGAAHGAAGGVRGLPRAGGWLPVEKRERPNQVLSHLL